MKVLDLVLVGWVATNALCLNLLASDSARLKVPLPSQTDCSFYHDLDVALGCTEADAVGYLEQYGKKYCARFKEAASTAWKEDPKLVSWVKGTTVCLQEMLAQNEARTGRCPRLAEFAFDVHPICYKEAGVCSLSPMQAWKVRGMVESIDIAMELRRSVVQALNVLACWVLGYSDSERDAFDRAYKLTRSLPEQERGRWGSLFAGLHGDEKKRNGYFAKLKVIFEAEGGDRQSQVVVGTSSPDFTATIEDARDWDLRNCLSVSTTSHCDEARKRFGLSRAEAKADYGKFKSATDEILLKAEKLKQEVDRD